jgi:hypothetical protein
MAISNVMMSYQELYLCAAVSLHVNSEYICGTCYQQVYVHMHVMMSYQELHLCPAVSLLVSSEYFFGT